MLLMGADWSQVAAIIDKEEDVASWRVMVGAREDDTLVDSR